MSELVNRFCEMVRIASESGNEEKFLGWLARSWAADLGAACEADGYGNLIARLPDRDCPGEPILLCAHADTVKPGVGVEPVLEEGVIRAQGGTVLGADDKAGIAAIWFGIKAASRRPPLEIVITREEEVGLRGAKNLDTSRLTAKVGFVLDGEAFDEVVIGGPSHFLIDVTVHGKAAHAGTAPEQGISAIKAAARAIARLPEGRIDHETTANVGVIRGGEIRNGVPARAAVQAECRSLSHDKAVSLADLYRRAFEEEANALGARAEVKVELAYRAVRLAEDEPAVLLAHRALEALGLVPKPRLICGGTDASILNMRGIKCAVLGMGARAPHTPDEHIRVEDLEFAVQLVKTLLELACPG
ncbi:TPA: M20/M25/M40 family metallo-hydrolase [Candidatus Bipolaricaulota bacterium]|nr:M20/M25/M40 family metallo-hydrolase [Candidatus Bipolaricaulota bacterium]